MAMKHLAAAIALAGIFGLAACDQNSDEAADEAAAIGEEVAAESGDAGDAQGAFDAAEAGCRAAADALAIWTARPWADAEGTVTGGDVATIRVIRPGDMVTKDYRTDRLNVELDENDIVTRVYCG